MRRFDHHYCDMSLYLLLWRNSGFILPIVILFWLSLWLRWGISFLRLFKCIVFHFIVRSSFRRFITLIITTFLSWGATRSISLVEAFENHISKLVLFKGMVNFFQDARRLCFHDTNVMNTTRADPDNAAVHQWFDELWSMSDRFNSIIVGRL